MPRSQPTISTAVRQRTRFNRVLDHIDTHLGHSLAVNELSALAALSRFHFQRRFNELLGMTVARYVQMKRLRRASFQLAFRQQLSITAIAFDNGYEAVESFTRAFSRVVGQSPSSFRETPRWDRWLAAFRDVTRVRGKSMPSSYHTTDVTVVDFPATMVGMLEHRGDEASLAQATRNFISWRRENRLPPSRSATFNIVYGHSPDECHYGLCAATDNPVAANEFGVVSMQIPPGRCARLRHAGSEAALGDAVSYLYREWLPASGESAGDFPLFFQRVSFYPEVPEHEAITDIYLPLV
ncbi:MAG: AraC family transcriptional regulator [Gammaproteobacteria bacterium]|nr:AraC family transcriptional regulator [Gammaproteobacteria bacterium]